MSYESTAEPIKLGYLMDFRLPPFYPQEMRDDFARPFELVFNEGLKEKLIDRRVEIVYREVEGLPKGTVKAVIDAYGELVDEGCLVIFGPSITDNAVPTREAIERRFRVPAVSVTGTDDWLGEWTFSFPQGSLTDEPRSEHHRQRRADTRGDRAALPGSGGERDRHRRLAGRVDVLVSTGLADRRAPI